MNAAQIKALIEWYKMLQGSAKGELLSQYGHLIPEETDAGRPSTMELAQRGRRETALANRPAATTGTLQGELEAVEIPTVPGKELAVIPRAEKQARVYEYKNVPNIQVDPSGEAKIISDLSASIKRYREMKTGMEPLGSRWEPERRLAATEQAIPDKELPDHIPEWALIQQEEMKAQNYQASEARKREVEKLRATQAGQTSKFDELIKRYQRAASKRLREMNRRSRGGMPFNPKLLESQGKFLPTGNPIQRALQRRLR